MKKSKRILAFLLACLIFGGTMAWAVDVTPKDDPKEIDVLSKEEYDLVYNEENYESEFVPGEIVIGLKSSVPETVSCEELFPGLGIIESTQLVKSVTDKGLIKNRLFKLKLSGETKECVIDAIDVLKESPYVYFAEPNYVIYPATVEPNDYHYVNDHMWNMDIIDAPDAWEITTGSHSVTVGVIDSGIEPVSDLYNNVDFLNYADYIDLDSYPSDYYGHGTHVAGIIGAEGNNWIDVVGVCWNVNLVSIKILDSGGYAPSDAANLLEGIGYAVDNELPIINMSLHRFSYSQSTKILLNAYQGLAIVAAGNDELNLDVTPTYPANYASTCDNMIVVGNSDQADCKADSSNYSQTLVDIFAPGEGVYSTTPWGVYPLSGTSMAAPHVAGTAALLLSLHPTYRVDQLKNAILESCDVISGLSSYCSTGGRLNVYSALMYDAFLEGDINNDGVVSNEDLILLGRYLVSIIDFTDDEIHCADMNHDGIINNADLIILSNRIVNN